ncbi:MAG: hypothetical protein GXO23_03370 [Crenarchaeota archaeon]|nr:hypothetical protein [Thermoproteota archaeon]
MSKKLIGVIIGVIIAIICIAGAAYYLTCTRHQVVHVTKTNVTHVTAPKQVVIVIGTTDTVTHLDPRLAYDFMSCEVVYNVFDTLVRYNSTTGKFEPWLAYKWVVKDNGTVWIFYLRKGVKFQNGEELTAEDVVYAIKSAIKEGTEPSWMLQMVFKDVKAIGKYEVEFIVKAPALVLPVLSFTVAAPIPKDVAEKMGSQFDLHPVGTGPFEVVKFVPGQYIILKRFDDYWNKKFLPKADEIIIRFFKDPNSMVMALEKGSIDIAYRHIPIQDLVSLEKNPNLVVYKGFPPFIRYLVIATEKVRDVRVRRALAYLIYNLALPKIINDIFHGYAKPLYSMVTPVLKLFYVPVFKIYVLNNTKKAIEIADKLLTEAGYSRTHKLTLVLGYTTDHYGPLEAYVAQAIKSALEASGMINVKVIGEEWGTFIQDSAKARKFDIFLLGWYPDYLGPSDYLMFFLHSGYDKTTTDYNNTLVDKLLDEAIRTPDLKKRIELYREVQEIMAKDVPVIPLWIPIYEYVLVARKDVKGVYLDPSGVLWFYSLYKG